MPRAARHRLHQITFAVSRVFVKAEKKNLPKLLSLYGLLLLAITSAYALNPSRHIFQDAHSAWRMDGFGDSPSPIAETKDGFMWFGTRSELLRFDSVTFRSPDINAGLPSSLVLSLAAAQDGSLWIGTERGLTHLVNERLINFPDVTGYVLAILEDRAGKIWFTVTDVNNDHAAAFCLVVDHGTRCYGKEDGVLMRDAVGLAQDADGNLWSSNGVAAVQWKPGSFRTYKPDVLKPKRLLKGVRAIAPTFAGFLWVGMEETGAGLGLQQLVHSRWKPFATSNFGSTTLPVTSLLSDRENTLWIGTGSLGLYRISGQKVDRFRSGDGLSSDNVHKI